MSVLMALCIFRADSFTHSLFGYFLSRTRLKVALVVGLHITGMVT